MTLREFYAGIDGSYDEAMKRLMNEKLMLRFLGKFAGSVDYAALTAAVEAGDWEAVFRLSHNMKGVCLNLGLGRLSRSVSALSSAAAPASLIRGEAISLQVSSAVPPYTSATERHRAVICSRSRARVSLVTVRVVPSRTADSASAL